ncbi:MAG: hypothetical protein GY928_34265 [Colwellia sp.]|nr:hypothetical protein [Colwellia sp.]
MNNYEEKLEVWQGAVQAARNAKEDGQVSINQGKILRNKGLVVFNSIPTTGSKSELVINLAEVDHNELTKLMSAANSMSMTGTRMIQDGTNMIREASNELISLLGKTPKNYG